MIKLQIRKMKITDAEALYALLSNAKVMEFLEPVFSMDKATRFLHEAGLCDPPLVFSVDDENGEFIGYVIYHSFDETGMEIGWVLKPEVWGRGYAENLTLQLIKMAHDSKKDAVIECVPLQKAAKKIALKCGFDYQCQIDGLDIYRRSYTAAF